jgi:hypothetical protein
MLRPNDLHVFLSRREVLYCMTTLVLIMIRPVFSGSNAGSRDLCRGWSFLSMQTY